jgi:aspartate dehydrogenase
LRKLRTGIIGGGAIGTYVLDALMQGKIENCEAVVLSGRSDASRGKDKVLSYGLAWVTEPLKMLEYDLDVIVEAASHDALEQYGIDILKAGVDFVPVSLGALVDDGLLRRLKEAAVAGGSTLHIPSGGIGGLDALQAAIIAGVDRVTMTTRKPPVAWKKIPYVDAMNLDLDGMTEPTVLYEGPARHCVREFPQNINIAADLSLAGIGFDRTIIRIVADPTIVLNTHEIEWEGAAGKVRIVMQNLPIPVNPKTTYQASLSILAALKRLRSPYHIGT